MNFSSSLRDFIKSINNNYGQLSYFINSQNTQTNRLKTPLSLKIVSF